MKTKNSENNEKFSYNDVYKMVTCRILDSLMKGQLPWREVCFAPKGGTAPYRNFVTGKAYSFLNCLLLGEPGEYASFSQIKERGGHIKKGSTSKIVIFWGEFIPKEKKEEAKRLEEQGESIDHLKVRFPKYYRVYNMKDVEGVVRKSEADQPAMESSLEPTDIARMAITDYGINKGVKVNEKPLTSNSTYNPLTDTVEVPDHKWFAYEEDWYAGIFRCLTHSTAREDRCDRAKEYEKMITGEMSIKEELIGEIASSMLLSACELHRKETHMQVDAVCQKYIQALENDYRLIVTASYAAEKAARFILDDSSKAEETLEKAA